MIQVRWDELSGQGVGDGGCRRVLGDALETEHLAMNHFVIPPGDGFPGGLHAHMDQEEVFLVLEGEATFETFVGKRVVPAGHAIRFAPGEFQSGTNASDSDLVAFALGAPRDSSDTRIPVACPECSHDTLRLHVDTDHQRFVCPGCGAERVPRDCPSCGGEDLRIARSDDDSTIAKCHDCAAVFDEPPMHR